MRIVLVRPRDPNNIGAVARVMANFGLSDLVVVAPHPPVWEEVRSAIGAEGVVRGTRVVATLAQAVAECELVAGTTAGTRRRIAGLVGPDAFALEAYGSASTARSALVFGNEKHGLTNDDLAHCNRFVRIATADAQPSLNLAQAVAICCYEVARHGNPATVTDGRTGRPRAPARATRASIDALARAVRETVAAKRGEAAAVRAAATLRDLLGRADARERDVSFLRGLLALLPHVDR